MTSSMWIASHALLWVLVILQAIVLVAVLRQIGSILMRLGSVTALDVGIGPDVGRPAPWLPRPAFQGFSSADDFLMLVFVSSGCGACEDLVPAMNTLVKAYARRVTLFVVSRDSPGEAQRWAAEHRLRPEIVSSTEAFTEYEIDDTPYAFVIDADGLVAARGGVNHVEHLEALVRRCTSSSDSEVATELPLVAGEGSERSDLHEPSI